MTLIYLIGTDLFVGQVSGLLIAAQKISANHTNQLQSAVQTIAAQTFRVNQINQLKSAVLTFAAQTLIGRISEISVHFSANQ
jgi:hypothetical protein